MAENIIEIRPEGTNDYADILYPKTRADAVIETATQKIMTAAERTKLGTVSAGAQANTVTSVAGRTGAITVTKADVGLSAVENYGVATQAEAIAGSINTKYMTPLRVKEAIIEDRAVVGTIYVPSESTQVVTLGFQPTILILSYREGSGDWKANVLYKTTNTNDFKITFTSTGFSIQNKKISSYDFNYMASK